ncbi:MAG: glycosyltransferase family 2 protein [Balneolia bacterium]|nr:glycosyltransferase family 2 protein [Balneolia bacterium]
MNPDSHTDSDSRAGHQDLPECSILFVFHNQQQHVESILSPWLAAEGLKAECIIFDDGSTDGTDHAISSLLDYHNSDNAFYFRNDLRRGTGLCLNEALREARAKTILVADSAATIEVEALRQVIKDLGRSQDSYTIPETHPAFNPADLSRHLKRQRIPSSINYLIRTDRIRPDRLFFNPFIQTGHSAELLMRAGASAHGREVSSFFLLEKAEDTYAPVSDKDASVIRFHTKHFAEEVSSVLDETGDVELLYEKAYSLLVEGRIADALQQCDIILKEHPRHDDTIALKINLLQRLKQFVKASELKHRQARQKQGDVIPDPDADSELKSSQIDEEGTVPELSSEETTEAEAQTAGEELTEEVPEETKEKVSPKPVELQPSLFGDEEDNEDDESEATTAEQPEPESEPEDEAKTKGDGYETRPVEPEPEPATGSAAQPKIAEEAEDDEEDPEAEEEAPYVRPESFRNTIIIPVAGITLPFIENCMITLHENCNPDDTELIIVDNVCMDETYQYLQQLAENHFFHARIIKNSYNKGFGAAVNQAIAKAQGEYLCIIHSDVALESNVPAQLSAILESNPDIGLVGPVTDKSFNESQMMEPSGDATYTEDTMWLDSFCLCMRKADGFTFDESYGIAWFEDYDLSAQVQSAKKRVAIATGVFLRHYLSGTSDPMGFGSETNLFHTNLRRYNKKWNITAMFPDVEEDAHPLEEIFLLGQVVHPLHPFDAHRDRIKELFTVETETELRQHKGMNDETLICFIRAMMAIDNRPMLRFLEEQLSGPVDDITGMELVQYYYDRHIYSRCRKHLNNIKGERTPLHLMFELRIAWGEKDMESAADHLNTILTSYPAMAEANHLAGEMHKLDGNKKEMEEFFEIAGQLDPYRYPWPPPSATEEDESGLSQDAAEAEADTNEASSGSNKK